MTWSQLVHFSRAAELARAVDWQMDYNIAVNPYQKPQDAKKLPRLLARMVARLQSLRRRPVDAARAAEADDSGIKLSELERVMGAVKRTVLSREEWEARRRRGQPMVNKPSDAG